MTQKPDNEKLEQRIKALEKEFAECKHALKASRENEERLELILQSTNDGIWDWDAKEDKAYSSPRFRELIGIAEEDDNGPVTWDDWASLIHPDDYDYVIRDFWKNLKEKIPYGLEYRYRHTNGEYRWHSSKGVAIFDEAGSIQRIVGSTWDITDRKTAEKELRKNEEKWRSFVTLTSDWIWEMNEQGIFTYVDANIRNFIGYEAEEVIGKKMSDIMPYELGKRAQHFLDKYNKLRKPLPMVELTHLHKDGREVICETSGVAIFDGKGNMTGWRGLNKDISERVHMERAIRKSEEKFRSLVETSSDWIFEIGRNSVFTYVDPKVKKFLGYDSTEIVGRPFAHFVTKDEAKRIERYFSAKGLPKAFRMLKITYSHKDGRSVVFETSGAAIIGETGHVTGWRGMHHGITEKVKADKEMRVSNAKFSAAFHSNPCAMIISSLEDERIIEVNESLLRVSGFGRNELIGGSAPLNLWADQEQRDRFVRELREHGEARNFEMDFIKARGEDVGIAFISAVKISLEDKPYLLGILIDVTDQKRSEKELKKYKDQLEDLVKQRTAQLEVANKELEAFAYSVSHDLRAPLRAIDGFSLALLEDYEEKLDDQGKDFLNRVRASSQRMGQLIDDILKLSRLTRSDMRYEDVDLSAMARTITQELQAGDPDRDVEVAINPDLIERGDHPLLQVALENLISNAWKFTAGQGHAQIKFGTEVIGEETVYFLSDNGAGFDMAYADKLFGAFQRLHSAEDFPGTGIGLATAQRAIHRHGGRIWAKGAVNEGATFYFTL